MGKLFGKRSPYVVTVHLDGRHPYLESTELDYETRDITLTVPAKSFDDAERQALRGLTGVRFWRALVVSIARLREPT